MRNYRLEVEQLILNTFLSQDHLNELDKCEIEDLIIPYKLFNANRAHKLIAKAIFNLQEEKSIVSDLTIQEYLELKMKLSEEDQYNYVEVIGRLWVSFTVLEKYIIKLEEYDKDEKILDSLSGIL